MNLKVILIVLAVIFGVVGFLILTDPKEETAGSVSNHTVGQGNTGVTLVEYGDFQCPGCRQYYPILKQVKEYYGDKITFQFKHFPLESIHKNARAAARAAEAAGKQDKFWEMHDKLFDTQDQWKDTPDPISVFEGYAEELGLDKTKFTNDYKDQETSRTITADLQSGRDLGVSSTPTFALNGKLIEQSPGATFEAFKALIDAKIAEVEGKDGQNNTENKDDQNNKPDEESQTDESNAQ